MRTFLFAGVCTLLGAGAGSPPARAAEGLDPTRDSVSLNFYDEPKSLDPQKANDHIAMTILGHTGEGLVRLDPANEPLPAQAESWEQRSPTSYAFKLREAARWSDGKRVTAGDFVYGW